MLYSTREPFTYSDPRETIGIITDRPGDMLLWAYGYAHINQLCSELPDSSAVLDLGSGASNFGHAVARCRPDITWTNFDARYGDEGISSEDREKIELLQASAPSNLNYVGGNILDPPDQVRAQRFGRIFSYYMFPYVIDYFGKEVAADAMENALGLLESDGQFSMGPIRYQDTGCWTVSRPDESSMRSTSTEMITRFTESWDDVERRRIAERS